MSLKIAFPTNYASVTQGGGMDPARGPMNQGISWIASSQLANYASRYNQQYENALKVDANILYFWLRTKHGTICTCSRPGAGSSFGASNAANAKPSAIRSPLDLKLRLTRMSEDVTPELQPGNDPIWNKLLTRPTSKFGFSQSQTGEKSANQRMAKVVNLDTADEAFPDNTSVGIYGGDKHACGICYSTGYTQGYTFFNGQRILLDASGEVPFTLAGATFVPNTYPLAFNPGINGAVIWQIELPTYVNSWLQLSVRNNLKPAPNCSILYSTDSETWNPLTLDVLVQTNGTVRKWWIKVIKNPDTDFNDPVQFTHVELTLLLGDPVYGTAPNIEVNIDYNAEQPMVRVAFYTNGRIPFIPRESVFTDSKYNQLWKVLDVQQIKTSADQVLAYIINARLVQRHEMLYSMLTVLYPNIEIPFRGLEEVQGDNGLPQMEEAGGEFQVPPFNFNADNFGD